MFKLFKKVTLKNQLRDIIRQGNNDEYAQLIKTICELHENEFTEENTPTRESFILELVTDAFNESRRKHGISEIPMDALFLATVKDENES